MSKNNVPSKLKGDFKLSIHGNAMELTDEKNDVKIKLRCHPDDEFDFLYGITEAFNERIRILDKRKKEEEIKRKEIKVGDYVEVVNPGLAYVTFNTLFKINNLFDLAIRYRYGVAPHKGLKGKVVKQFDNHIIIIEAKDDKVYGDKMYANLFCQNGVYVIEEAGVKKVKK